jgi:deazaflavin-dependent oxidoreductase (nitroreductase family)
MSKVQAPDQLVTDRRYYGPFIRAVQRVGQARSFTVVVTYAGSKLDRVLCRASRGRITLSGPSPPMMLLTTRDRKTREPRTVPAFYLRDGHNLAATYENFESAEGGSWPANLRADPRVTIQIGSTVASYAPGRLGRTRLIVRCRSCCPSGRPTTPTCSEATRAR